MAHDRAAKVKARALTIAVVAAVVVAAVVAGVVAAVVATEMRGGRDSAGSASGTSDSHAGGSCARGPLVACYAGSKPEPNSDTWNKIEANGCEVVTAPPGATVNTAKGKVAAQWGIYCDAMEEP